MSASWWSKQQAGSAPVTPAASPAPANVNGTPATASTFANFFAAKPATTKPQTTIQPHSIPVLSSAAVLDLLKSFRLEGSEEKYETTMVFAKSNNNIMGGEDASLVGLRWFRAAEGGKFEELYVSKPFFQPSVDDVDKRLCVQCYDLKDETSSSFVEYGPIRLDPKVAAAAAQKDAKVKAKTGSEEIEISRSVFPPNLVVFKRQEDGSNIEETIPSWRIIPHEAKRVLLGDGRELEFVTSADRDIATILVRTNPPRSRTGSVASVDESTVLNGEAHITEMKQLKERVMELEAQLMATRARGGAAETGKALAEAQSLRRELDKIKLENANLVEQLVAARKSKSDSEERMKAMEREAALASLREQTQNNLQRELDTTRETLNKTLAHLKAAKERADKAELSLDDVDRSVPELEARAKRAEDKVKELEGKLSQALAESERAVGRKNAALQKADSLAKDLARLLKATPGGLEEVESTIRENATLKSTVEDLRSELRQIRAAYEAQIASGKVHSAKTASGTSSISGSAANQKATQLEHLANSLMSEVKSKDEIIETQRSEIKRLNLRLQELYKRGKDGAGSLSN